MRQQVKIPQPGDIIDGGPVGVPRYERLSGDLRAELAWLDRARRHTMVDGLPASAARQRVAIVGRLAKRLAAYAAQHGAHLVIHNPESLSGRGRSYDSPPRHHVRAVIWLVREHQIIGDLTISSGRIYCRHDDNTSHRWQRADVTYRRVVGKR